MIKNLIFDFGGVFCTADLDSCVAAFKDLGFNDIENYLNRYAQKGKFGDLEAGKITDYEFLEYFRSHTGREVSYEECRNAWLSFIAGLCEENLAQIPTLKPKAIVWPCFPIPMLSSLRGLDTIFSVSGWTAISTANIST